VREAGLERHPTGEYWESQRVLVTGANGFLGSVLVEQLRSLGCAAIASPTQQQADLTDPATVRELMQSERPDMVIHLAAEVGGIGANQDNPGRFFYANLVMGLHLIEEARLAGVDKFVQLGTICAYPKHTSVPFREEDLWDGYPEETNAPYGIAKKALLVQLQAYREQYGLNGIYLLPVNLYGPGDNFDPRTSHVIPALIKKMTDARKANERRVTLWGSGSASREFLYVDDCARAVVLAAEHYDGPAPVNVGTGMEITISDLAARIADVTGFQGELAYDLTKPDGQPRRCLDTSRALQSFGFRASVSFDEGLRETFEWYEEHGPR